MVEQEQARELRAQAWTIPDIAVKLGVAKSSVSLWVRDVQFTPSKRRTGPRHRPHPGQRRKAEQIVALDREGVARLGVLNDQAFLAAGAALYAGEGSKTEGSVSFANSDVAMVSFFCEWLRTFFPIDESRLRVRIYLHQGLDLEAATNHWSAVTGVPVAQFRTPYRAAPDPSIGKNKHEFGCVYVRYGCSKTHRAIMGLCRALLSSSGRSGVAQSAEQFTVNELVGGSSPSPGASGFEFRTGACSSVVRAGDS